MRIGLVPMAAKPYHAGHHALVTAASSQSDKVLVFVSLSNRERKGEFPIYGADMEKIWRQELASIMPPNVDIIYVSSPVRSVWETLEKADSTNDPNTYVIYSDPVDTAQNYPDASLAKYCNDLRSSGQCILAAEEHPGALTRGDGTPNVSGTKVRAMLKDGDVDGFAETMPPGVDAHRIFSILTKKQTSESHLRKYIRAVISG